MRSAAPMTPNPRKLDFTEPMQVRKWLGLLVEDPVSALKIPPNLKLPPSHLGFDFASNAFGLHGPCSVNAPGVVLGTSFAMGFAVDDGKNWFDQLLRPAEWFNAGFPVGPVEWTQIVDTYYRGDRSLALFIYHPNTWPNAISYTQWRTSGLGLFDFFGWKIGFWECLRLHFRRRKSGAALEADGRRLIFKSDGREYRLDSTYSNIKKSECLADLSEPAAKLKALLGTFQRVICVRVPIKEDLTPPDRQNSHFLATKKNYDDMWAFTRDLVLEHPRAFCNELSGFELRHYHGFDTHLNEAGNTHLSQRLRELLTARGEEKFCL